MADYTYSAGNSEIDHDEFGRFSFPKSQHLYHESWSLVVTDLADDYHSYHDGWESTWPLEFRIYKDGSELARFNVDCEHEPRFYESQISPPPFSSPTREI